MTPGSTIAHYRITAKLGEGGMGEVWRATDTKLNREVAIKMLPAAFAKDPARMSRFEREAQVLASLNHPNIAGIYGVEQGGLVMEFVAGADLKGPVAIDTALDDARQIAEGLEAAHEKGIIHRDLKPANIKVTPEGKVKLLDFGLAKATEESSGVASQSPTMSPTLSLGMTQSGVILGTAAYMSPEQARGKRVDRRADIWAFGVVLYEMLTGSVLFGGGETISDSLAAVITKEPDWETLPKDTPPRIRKLLQRCLQKDPKQRMRDVGEARLAIDEPEPAAAPEPAKQRVWLPWSVTSVVLVAAALAALFVWLKPKPADLGAVRFVLPMPQGNSEASAPATPNAVPSLDGSKLAFVARETSSGKQYLWVRPLDSVEAHRLDKTEGASQPFWSPDGQFIAYFADDKLKRIGVASGSPQTVCELPKSQATGLSGESGTWNKDGVIVFGSLQGLLRVPATGGVATTLTTVEKGERYHASPQFMPDGKHLIYFVQSGEVAKRGVYIRDLSQIGSGVQS